MPNLYCIRDRGTLDLPDSRRCAPMPGVYEAEWTAEVWVNSLDNGIAIQVEDLPRAFDWPTDGRRLTCEDVTHMACNKLRRMRRGVVKVRVSFRPINTPTHRMAEAMWTAPGYLAVP